MSNPLPDEKFVMVYAFLFEHVLNQPIKKLNPDYKGTARINEKDFVWYLTALSETSGGKNLFFRSSGRVGAKYGRSATAIKNSWRKLTLATLFTPKAFRLRNHRTEAEIEFGSHEEAVDYRKINRGWDFSTTKYVIKKPEQIFDRLGLKSTKKFASNPKKVKFKAKRIFRQNEQSAWTGPISTGAPKSKDYSIKRINTINNKESANGIK